MARTSTVGASAYANRSQSDAASAELTHLLCRLQDSVLHPSPDRERLLRTSPYERARLASNLQYARETLGKLEHDAEAVKAPARRMEVQGILSAQKDMLELLFDRLEDLKQMAVDDEDDDSSDGEDLLGDIIQTPSQSADSIASEPQEEQPHEPPAVEHSPPTPPPMREPEPIQYVHSPQPAEATSTLRERRPGQSQSTQSYTTARAALFANRRKPTTAEPQVSTATAEAILDHQKQEQDALSDSILKMASALKSSSQKFSTTLEADKDVVGRAGEGIEKTERSMEAARGRMGVLKKMTEGKGWWGRMILYAWVYGLMLTLMIFVFVLPKLRF